LLSDKIGKRAVVIMPMLFLAALLMLAFKILGGINGIIFYYIFIFGIGVCSIGPYNIIGSAIQVDLAEQP